MAAYLSSGDIKGLGPTYAQRVVEHFGLDTLEVLDKNPERLLEVRGIGKHRLKQIILHLKRESEHRDILSTLRGMGIGDHLSRQLLRKYQEDTLAIIHKNPYRLAQEVRGIGFKRADAIALSLGINPESPLRIEATVLHLLREAESQGHCHLPYSEICARSQKLNVPLSLVEDMLQDMIEDARLYCCERHHEDPPLSRPALGRVERRVAARLIDIQQAQPKRTLQNLIPIDLPEIEHELGIQLNTDQRSAVESVFRQQVTVITGGPGTGKTTIVRALMTAAEQQGEVWELSAPTGRASKRLMETTGLEAKTVHRLLSYSGHTRKFTHHKDNPLSCHAVLIDEASMLDIWLFDSVLNALKLGCKLILVGDVDQLPSVGPGRVLSDIIASKVLPVVRLTEVYRQAQDSNIVTNAHRVNKGHLPISCELDVDASPRKDFFVLLREDPEHAQQTLLDVVSKRMPKLGFNPLKDVQVLTPMHSGPLGTEKLNLLLQAELNHNTTRVQGGMKEFRKEDRVIQSKNDYDKDIYNGDVGCIIGPTKAGVRVEFDDKMVDLESSKIRDLDLAYAVTVHKSQGSEYPAVVVIIHNGHRMMLRRNLLYTAITRAR
ncbi:MAG: ATP-dependent RecD-like DNA helicase, partial [Myxococcota bacterium]|nr:ATP-dependent RecD-like DNA helicase [Myxococcota bacterium]